MGYLLTIYRRFFDAPPTIDVTHFFWLTSFIGASWYRWVSPLAIGFRVLWAVTLAASAVVAFWILRPYRLRYLGPALAFTMVWLCRDTLNWFYYDPWSALLALLGTALLLRAARGGSSSGRVTAALLAGLFMGASAMARIPGIVGLGAVALLGREPDHDAAAATATGSRPHGSTLPAGGVRARHVAAFVFGCALCAIAVAGAMHALGHLEGFTHDVSATGAKAGATSERHSLRRLAENLVLSTVIALVLAAALTGVAALVRAVRRRWPHRGGLHTLSHLAVFALVAWLSTRIWGRFIVAGLTYIVFLDAGFALGAPAPTATRSVTATAAAAPIAAATTAATGSTTPSPAPADCSRLGRLALLLLVLPQLGSNVHIRNAIFGSWLAVPLAISCLAVRRTGWTGALRALRGAIGGGLIVAALIAGAQGPFEDRNWRWQMTATMDHPLLAGVFTTPARARCLGELLDELSTWRGARTLLPLNRVPLVFYLTDFAPLAGRPWLENAGDQTSRLAKALAACGTATLPLVVRATQETAEDWPTAQIPPRYEPVERRAVVEAFMQQHGYRRVWHNDAFEIFATPAMAGPGLPLAPGHRLNGHDRVLGGR